MKLLGQNASSRTLIEALLSPMNSRGRRRDNIVARFKAYLEAHPRKSLYLAEVCPAIGTSERTLRDACTKRLGMGPIRYLSLRRMQLVRRALLQAVPSTTTVTRIAMDHGFGELGRFSVNYRVCLEKPLRNPCGDCRMIGAADVCSEGKTGSNRRAGKATPLIHDVTSHRQSKELSDRLAGNGGTVRVVTSRK